MIRDTKSIVGCVIRKWLQSESFEMHYFKLTVYNNEVMIVDSAGDTLWLIYDNDTKSIYIEEQEDVRVFGISRRITALEFALDYTPGQDNSHSHSVPSEMLDGSRAKEMDPNGSNRRRSMDR